MNEERTKTSLRQVEHIRYGDDRKTFQVMTSTYPIGSLGSVASLLSATLIGITNSGEGYGA